MSGTCSDKKFIAVVISALFPVDFPSVLAGAVGR